MKMLFRGLIVLIILTGCSRNKQFKSFSEYPVYEGTDLELNYSSHSSNFRIWAPTADQVKLLLYENGSEGGAYQTIDMKESDGGTWKIEVDGDLKGKFYTFQLKRGEKWSNETPGIWVKAVGINGKRAAIIDFQDTNPEGWEGDEKPDLKNFTDIIQYETNLREFSLSTSSGIKNKGKFLSLTEHKTLNAGGEPTGIDHLKELGITHLHLLPIFDFDSIDESLNKLNKYGRTCNGVNFNVPEGSFSSKPADPKSRIKEFKQMVMALHKSGIRVILDMDFSHCATASTSGFNIFAPGYFFRLNPDSTFFNGSSFGNELASERPMMRKFILETLNYWASEYHIDGFNIINSGSVDIETINAVRASLDKVDPTIFLSVDGITKGKSLLNGNNQTTSQNAEKLDFVAVYNHDLFYVLRDSLTNHQSPGFLSSTDSMEEVVKYCIAGAAEHPQVDIKKFKQRMVFVNSPTQVINYLSNYDVMNLRDRLATSNPAYMPELDLLRINKLGQSILLTSQGIPSLYAGDEFGRTKKNASNTNFRTDSTALVDWNSKSAGKDLYDYVREFITLRKKHAAFRISSAEMVQQYLTFLDTNTPHVVGYVLTDHVNGDAWKDIIVIHNANRQAARVTIPAGQWTVVCHDATINLNGISQIGVNDTVFTVAPTSTSILFDE
jgi:pullulanase